MVEKRAAAVRDIAEITANFHSFGIDGRIFQADAALEYSPTGDQKLPAEIQTEPK